MFLANLVDTQKKAFLNLAQALIEADGVLDGSESIMMEQYRQEMNLPVSVKPQQQPIEQSAKVFESADLTIKKQVVFELVALACADNDYANEEYSMIEKVGSILTLDTTFLRECRSYVDELTALYERITEFVGK